MDITTLKSIEVDSIEMECIVCSVVRIDFKEGN